MLSIILQKIRHNTFHALKRKIPLLKKWYIRYHLNKGTIIYSTNLEEYLNVRDNVTISLSDKNIRVGLVKPIPNPDFDGFVQIADYWPKYERFMRHNQISFSLYAAHSSTWQKDAENFDVVLYSIPPSPFMQAEAKTKIYFLEKYLKIKCFPSHDELWCYEDKVRTFYLLKHYGLPSADTFITNSKEEILTYLKNISFPIISKITTGSGSKGVEKIHSRQAAINVVNSVFSENGRLTYLPGVRQKDYVYFQKFINDAEYDLRVIVVGEKLFGYYRYPKKGDFRASGSHILRMKELPDEAMRLALRTKEIFNSTILAVDMLYSEKNKKYYIIEVSINVMVDSTPDLVLNGRIGYYEYKNDSFTFIEGKYWLQDLSLQEFFSHL